MFPLVRIGNVAAHAWVVMDEHATYAQSYVVGNASDNRGLIPALFANRVPGVSTLFLLSSE